MGAGELVIYTGYALTFLATFLFARTILIEQDLRAAEENLDELKDRKEADGLVKITRPFFTQYIVPMVRGRPKLNTLRTKAKRKLISAGMSRVLTADELIAYKAFLIVFFPIVGGTLQALGLIDVSKFFIVFSGILGWFYPDFWLNSKMKWRQNEIRKAMPFIVDLLALSTEAGLDFVGAIGKVVEKAAPSPLVDELGQLLKEIRVGSSRAEALREMGVRINMSEVNSFVAILISADQMGASIGKVLRQQSDQIRSERFVRAEKAGAAAGPKLILVTATVIFPAVLLMILGPFLLSFSGQGSLF